MRAYPYVQFSLAVIFLIAVSLAGTLVCPQDAMAREADYKMVTTEASGGNSGGGEWRIPPEDPPDEMSMVLEGTRGRGTPGYSEPRPVATGDSWAESVNAMIIRTVRFVGTTFSELF